MYKLSREEFQEWRIALHGDLSGLDNSAYVVSMLYSYYLEGFYHDRVNWVNDEVPDSIIELEQLKKLRMLQAALDI